MHSAEPVDYIVYDYLSEITMSLLARAKAKQPNMGYCPDFVLAHMRPNLAAIKKKGSVTVCCLTSTFICTGIRIVSNAGGLNPGACAAALRQLCKEQNVLLSIATVDGDDLWSNAKAVDFSFVWHNSTELAARSHCQCRSQCPRRPEKAREH